MGNGSCKFESCNKPTYRNHEYCPGCYFGKIRPKRKRVNRANPRVIVASHPSCSADKALQVSEAQRSWICGSCKTIIESGSELVFSTVCLECSKNYPSSSKVVPKGQQDPDTCDDCGEFISGDGVIRRKDVKSKIATNQATTEANELIELSRDQGLENRVPIKSMIHDIDRTMRGVRRISRTALLERLMHERGYNHLEAIEAVTLLLSTGAWVEEHGEIKRITV